MNLFIKLLLCALVIAVAGPMFLKGPDGKPLLNLGDLAPDVSGTFSESLGKLKNGASSNFNGEGKVYKWKDENGVWQLSDAPPIEAQLEAEAERRKEQGAIHGSLENDQEVASSINGSATSFEVMDLPDPNTNIIAPIPESKIKELGISSYRVESETDTNKRWGDPKESSKSESNYGTTTCADGFTFPAIPLLTVSSDKICELKANAQNVAQIMENREQQIDEIVSQ